MSFSNDELVIDISKYSESRLEEFMNLIAATIKTYEEEGINFRAETFLLRKIPGTDGYVKRFLNKEGYDLKGLDSITMPFVLRAYNKEESQDTDLVFEHEGRLAKLLEPIYVLVV